MRFVSNEQVVVRLLSGNGPMSKQQLQDSGRMAWATVVKIVDRLLEAGIVRRVGTLKEPDRGRGKRAYVFELAPDYPLVLGVDVEHAATTLGFVNLKGEVLQGEVIPSPRAKEGPQLHDFLVSNINRYLSTSEFRSNTIGVGIGMPRLRQSEGGEHSAQETRRIIQENLRHDLATGSADQLFVDSSVMLYGHFERWINQPYSRTDFALVTFRGGLGLSVFLGGRFLEPAQGFPGAFAHLRLVEAGRPCWCGGVGCVETVANHHYFAARLRGIVHGSGAHHYASTTAAPSARAEDVARLFDLAADGNAEAQAVFEESSTYVASALAPIVSALNVPSVIVSGHFGPNGGLYARNIESRMRESMLPALELSVRYVPLEDRGFLVGAALQVFDHYFATARGKHGIRGGRVLSGSEESDQPVW